MTKQSKYQPHTGNDFMYDVLLPCPSCGSDAELLFKGNDYTKSRSVIIKCKKCRLQRTDGTIYQSSEWGAKVCIDLWNTRTQE